MMKPKAISQLYRSHIPVLKGYEEETKSLKNLKKCDGSEPTIGIEITEISETF